METGTFEMYEIETHYNHKVFFAIYDTGQLQNYFNNLDRSHNLAQTFFGTDVEFDLLRLFAQIIASIPKDHTAKLFITSKLSHGKGVKALSRKILINNNTDVFGLVAYLNTVYSISLDEYENIDSTDNVEILHELGLNFDVFVLRNTVEMPVDMMEQHSGAPEYQKELDSFDHNILEKENVVQLSGNTYATPVGVQVEPKIETRKLTPPNFIIPLVRNIHEIFEGEYTQIDVNTYVGKVGSFNCTILVGDNNHDIVITNELNGVQLFVAHYRDSWDGNKFTRVIVKRHSLNQYDFESHSPYELVRVSTSSTKTKFITPLTSSREYKNTKFIALDIETYLDSNGVHIPYAAGFRLPKGRYPYTFYGEKAMEEMQDEQGPPRGGPVNKNKNHYIFAHNQGKYDGFLLQPYLQKRGKVSIQKGKDGSIIKLTLTVGKSKNYYFALLNQTVGPQGVKKLRPS